MTTHKNTYKSRRSKSLFTHLEQRIRLEAMLPQGLPKHYTPRLLFLFIIGVVYVGNTHYHEKLVRKIAQLERKTEELRADYTTLQAEHMLSSKQSEVAKEAAKLDLYETPYPPLKIKTK